MDTNKSSVYSVIQHSEQIGSVKAKQQPGRRIKVIRRAERAGVIFCPLPTFDCFTTQIELEHGALVYSVWCQTIYAQSRIFWTHSRT